ncbi:hypothetical protein HMPREF1402_01526 [Helicobacter pylori GAM121Aii]|nr:hypothetical protein HMPREF1402_01526 [Helicobacter pylori GAM121Aii]
MKKDREKNKNTATSQMQPPWVQLLKRVRSMLAPIESINQALVRLGKKKLHVLSHTASNFLDHFHRLKRLRITIGIKDIDMQDLRKQISNARNLLNKLNTNGIDGDSALGVIAGCGGLGASSFTAGAVLGGGLAASGLAGMTVLGWLVSSSFTRYFWSFEC